MSERPHPWAYLRDHLDPAMVTVDWALPTALGLRAAVLRPALWLVAGSGVVPAPGLRALGGRLLTCLWVGPAPNELPAPPRIHPDWRSLAAAVEAALAVRAYGLRLAPGRGLILADGSFAPAAPEVEALLSAHPDGLPAASAREARSARARVAACLTRRGLPLRARAFAARVVLEGPE